MSPVHAALALLLLSPTAVLAQSPASTSAATGVTPRRAPLKDATAPAGSGETQQAQGAAPAAGTAASSGTTVQGDEDWQTFPGQASPEEPPAEAEVVPASHTTPAVATPAVASPAPLALPPSQLERPAPSFRSEDFNLVSIFGAHALGQGGRAVGAFLGFPLVGARAAYGLTSNWDIGLGFDSFYGVMNDVRLTTRFTFFQGKHVAWALAVEGGPAFFTQRPAAEDRGGRWLTGRRNWNVVPGVMVSVQGGTPQAARLFADVRYQLAVDTEPFQRDPLGGIPPGMQLVHSLPVRFGAELPFSPSTSFLAHFGFDLHFDPFDSPFMPTIGVGVVTGF